MTKVFYSHFIVLLGAILSSTLIISQGVGYSIWLCTVGTIAFLFIREPSLFLSKKLQITSAGLLIMATLNIATASLILKATYLIFLVVFIGLTQASFLRFIWYHSLISVYSFIVDPWSYLEKNAKPRPQRTIMFWTISLILMTILAFFIFLFVIRSVR